MVFLSKVPGSLVQKVANVCPPVCSPIRYIYLQVCGSAITSAYSSQPGARIKGYLLHVIWTDTLCKFIINFNFSLSNCVEKT